MQDPIKRIANALLFSSLFVLSACGGGSATLAQYSIGGSVNGLLAGNSLVLQNNGTDTVTIAQSGDFSFSGGFAPGASYAVTVLTQPPGQTCTITNGSGNLPDARSVLGTPTTQGISNVAVNCSVGGGPFTVSGTAAGLLSGNSLVLEDNGGNATTVAENGPFGFGAAIAAGTPYAVTIVTQPAGQNCTVGNGSGAAILANVTTVTVVCSDENFNVAAAVSGLATNASVVLQLNGGDNLTVAANGTSNFSTPIAAGSAYAVAILTQPAGQTCTVTNASGTIAAANVMVPVVCSTPPPSSFSIGGTVTGLSNGAAVVLQNNGGNATTVSANASFTFSAAIASGTSYAVTVATQPTGQICTVGNGSGTVASANVTNVTVACTVTTYTIGGTLSGLNGTVVLQDNGSDTLSITANGSFTFATALASGASYAVTIETQPAGQTCAVSGGSGTVAAANVTSVGVSCTANVAANTGQWTWEGGPNTGDAVGVYGTQGMAAAGNAPGGRSESISWTDSSGNFWLFGGAGFGASTQVGSLNDLWMYNPTTKLWTWESGSSTTDAVSVYGTQGIAAAGNVPGARNNAVSWIDKNGNFWLFGGGGYIVLGGFFTNLDDLWMYNPSTKLWTWESGSNVGNSPGIYGTQGMAAASNVPGARAYAASWVDSSGNLWLFGGTGIDSVGNYDDLNDLWMYDPSTKQWTWENGSATGNVVGVYGTQGTSAAGNVIGARNGSITWMDSAGHFWLFGGTGYDSSGGSGFLNDLWMYDPTTQQWTWESGSNIANAFGVYGTEGTAATGNIPGARHAAISWIDVAGNFWLFGGYGNPTSAASTTSGDLNDIWMYNPSTKLWTWEQGASSLDAPGVYGTQGSSGAANVVGARNSAIAWIDSSGNFWLFGGAGYDSTGAYGGDLSDLWKFVP